MNSTLTETAARERMLREIETDVAYTQHMTGRAHLDERVMEAMKTVPRHQFVPEGLRNQAYDNCPLPIGQGQTISQPFIVALMTDLLDTEPDDEILEIGTGSGYQAAVLSRLVKQVRSVEVIDSLLQQAQGRFEALGYSNIECRLGDGHEGWSEASPFDGIIVAAATPVIPVQLLEQLKPGAWLVMPIGEPDRHQTLVRACKDEEGEISVHEILNVAFVPLISK